MLRHTPRTQDEKLPLHYAAAKGAPLGVMKFLLDANPKALTATDKVSPLSPTQASVRAAFARSCLSPCPRCLRPPHSLCRGCPGHCVAQDRKLPLHYAAEKDATLEVVKLLLGSQGNATTATAEDKVRRSANITTRTPCPLLPHVLSSPRNWPPYQI
jgi:hypothetical protein